MLIFRRVCSLMVLFFFSIPFANAQDCKSPTIFFVNGVWNDMPSQAEEGSKELYLAAIAQNAPNDAYVRPLFNPGDGLLADVAEVATNQLLVRGTLDFFTLLLEMTNQNSLGMYANYIDWLKSQMDHVAALERNKNQIKKVKETILEEIVSHKKPVLLIAHSQGNILVNQAVQDLKTHWLTQNIVGVQAIGVMGIGVASRLDLSKLPYSSRLYKYITFDEDLIIKQLPLLGELDANFFGESSLLSLDPTNHTLINTYLGEYTHGYYMDSSQSDRYSRTIIGDLIKDMYQRTAEAWPCISLTATPVQMQTEMSTELIVSVTAGSEPLLHSSASITISGESDNRIICQNVAVIAGKASCSGVTFPVDKEKENFIISLSRGSDYPEIKYPPVEILCHGPEGYLYGVGSDDRQLILANKCNSKIVVIGRAVWPPTLGCALKINNDGDVAGCLYSYNLGEPYGQAFYYSKGKLEFIAPNNKWPSVSSFNDLGKVLISGYIWSLHEGLKEVGVYASITSINNMGEMGGSNYGLHCGLYSCPAIFSQGLTVNISDPRGLVYPRDGYVIAINNKGAATGYFSVTQDFGVAISTFIYQNGVTREIGGLSEHGLVTLSTDINDANEIVGSASADDEGNHHAFIYSDEKMIDLGTLAQAGMVSSRANAINNKGQVVGTSWVGSEGRAFVWDKSNGMRDLNDLLSSHEWTVTHATDINDNGQIVGVATKEVSGSRIDHIVLISLPELKFY